MEISTLESSTKKGRNQGKVFCTAKMEIDILVIGNQIISMAKESMLLALGNSIKEI